MDRENPSRYSEIATNFVLRCACSFEQFSSEPEQCVANTGKHAGMERVKDSFDSWSMPHDLVLIGNRP